MVPTKLEEEYVQKTCSITFWLHHILHFSRLSLQQQADRLADILCLCSLVVMNVSNCLLFIHISGYSYRITVTLDGPSLPNLGFLYVALIGENDNTEEYQLHL